MKSPFLLFLLLTLFFTGLCFSQEGNFSSIKILEDRTPKIASLKNSDKDIMLLQFDAEVEDSYKALFKGLSPSPSFYAYTAQSGDTVQNLAARLNLRPSAFTIINGITSAGEDIEGKTLILPTVKGLFVPAGRTENSLEILLQENRFPLEKDNALCYNIRGRDFFFFAGSDFSTTEYAFFLDTSIVLPVKNYVISSRYGSRPNPFGGQKAQFHKGLDMAVPEGTSVFCCKGGIVMGTGENRVYGKWVQIDHGKGMTSFYAHLSSIEEWVARKKPVRSGQRIAKSGSTGQVTGPHLHFEIRVNGQAVNPEAYGDF